MSFLKNKLDSNLKNAVINKDYKVCRVLIQYKSLEQNIESKIKSFKGEHICTIPSTRSICAKVPTNAIERLIEYPEVSYICFDSIAHLCGSNTGFSLLSSNNITFQERYKLTGKGIGIGIVDSGTYPHVDLTTPNNKIKCFVDLINKLKYPYDDNGHGTFMSGLICGNGHLSKGMYRGIAENSHLFSVKAFNSIGRAYVSDILYGIHTIIMNKETYNLRVICLPFEITGCDYHILSLFSNIFDYAVKEGIIVVVPSGNNGNDECSIRGISTLPNCITIGGLDTQNSVKPYKYSSSGPYARLEKPDFSAACVNICSLNTNKDYISERNGVKLYSQPLDAPYTSYTGTSCGAAFISGVIALLFENNPKLTFKDVVSLLKLSCTLLNMPKHLQGSGMLELNKLLP